MKAQNLSKITAFSKKHVRTFAALAFAALVCAAVYTDWQRSNSVPDTYLYTASLDSSKGDTSGGNSDTGNIKILGEATFVDSTSPENSPATEVSDVSTSDNYFLRANMDRERKRDDAIATLQTVVDSSEAMPDAKDVALSEMIRLASNMEAESNIETMVKAKGFEDCIAVINSENVSVIVKTSGLLTHEVAQIQEIAMVETGLSAENVKIIEKN